MALGVTPMAAASSSARASPCFLSATRMARRVGGWPWMPGRESTIAGDSTGSTSKTRTFLSKVQGERTVRAMVSSASDGVLDEALERLQGFGPEYGPNGFSNHGPMAADALVHLGRGDAVIGWVDSYRKRLDQPVP